MKSKILVLCVALAILPALAPAARADSSDPFEIVVEQLGQGVYVASRPDPVRAPVEGNVTVIVDDDDVVVVDAAGTPLGARRIIEAVRGLTDKPVRYLVNTHGHGDHTVGNAEWTDAFPGLEIVGHRTLVNYMENGGLDYVQRTADDPESQRQMYRDAIADGRTYDPKVAEWLRHFYEEDLFELAKQYADVRIQPPTLAVDDGMLLRRGDRDIEILHIGFGDTPSDLIVRVPDAGIVAVGDMLPNPIPFGFTDSPLSWRETLGKLDDLDFDTLIPGHGRELEGAEAREYLGRVIALLDSAIGNVKACVAEGLSEEETVERVDLADFEANFTGGDPLLAHLFDRWLRQPLIPGIYQEVSSGPVAFDSERWKIEAQEHRIEEHLGRQALMLRGGRARLDDVSFLEGIIEFDIAFSAARGFPGVLWRMQDEDNYEEFYLRPHQSGNPDANQYTPVFNGLSGWQLYYGEEFAAPISYRFDEWMHVKIVVNDDRAEIYVDSDDPVLVVNDLRREAAAGGIGLSVPEYAPAWYSNFRYEPRSSPPLRSPAPPAVPTPRGTVTSWSVSSPFDEAVLDGPASLDELDLPELSWTSLPAEPSGIANLARLSGVAEGANTVFARATLRSDRERTVRVRFGYSDRVKVFLDGRPVYSGDNGYESRDYRYLGTIGLFDEVWLPLHRGDNEVSFAVSESFGGWGIVARIDEADGVEPIYEGEMQ